MLKRETFLNDLRTKMEKSLEALKKEISRVRTGRASLAILDGIRVNYYGVPTPLQQLATISAPEPRLLTIRPFSPGDIGAIEKAILKSDLGLTPSNDGKLIRLIIPRLTEERRRDLVKLVARRVEEGRVAIRNIRRDSINDLREFEKEKMISEDELHRGIEEMQELTDRYIERVDEVGKAKEAEIMEV